MPMGLPSMQMSAGEYLAWEREQVERHEFCRGEVFAMSGGSFRHSALAVSVSSALHVAARARGCTVHSSDRRVVLRPGEHYVYPDITVVCGTHELGDGASDVLANPTVVVEILSPSTEAYDRGDKWAAYRQLSSLREYVLVSQARPCIEVFRREESYWVYDVVETGERVSIADGLLLDVDTIYAGVFELPS